MSVISQTKPVELERSPNPVRVMVVDDSAVIRGIIARWLEQDPEIFVVASVSNGEAAVRRVRSCEAEVIILDVEMPIMDGMTALPLLIEEVPDIQIIMASTVTKRNARISLDALALGAADCLAKPETNRKVINGEDFRQLLHDKVKALGLSRRKSRGEAVPGKPRRGLAVEPGLVSAQARRDGRGVRKRAPVTPVINLVDPSMVKPRVLVIGSSTGGPQALASLMPHIRDLGKVPVLITQHMPPTFTAILANHLSRLTSLDAAEGQIDELVQPGRIYVAPGDYHMSVFEDDNKDVRIRLDQSPTVNYCRPSVEPMLDSVVDVYGAACLFVMLTGMGHDGLNAAKRLVGKGGTVIAQNEETSVVWGMPGAVAAAGICNQVLPISDLGSATNRLLSGGNE